MDTQYSSLSLWKSPAYSSSSKDVFMQRGLSSRKFSNFNGVSTLDSIGSQHLCFLIFLPLTLALAFFVIPFSWKNDWSIVNYDLRMHRGSGSLYVNNLMQNHQWSFTLLNEVNSLGYVQSELSANAYNLTAYECKSGGTSLLDGTVSISNFIGARNSLASSSLRTSHTVVSLNEFNNGRRINCSTAAAQGEKSLILRVPLAMEGFDWPGIISSAQQFMKYNVSAYLPPPYNSQLARQLRHTDNSNRTFEQSNALSRSHVQLRHTIISQNSTYALLAAVVALLLSFCTCGSALYLLRGVAASVAAKRSYGAELSSAHSGNSLSSTCCSSLCVTFNSVTSEQYVSLMLLFFLLLWQNPLGAFYVLSHFLRLVNLTDSALFTVGLCNAFSGYGLLFSMILYVGGLKYNSMSGSHSTASSVRTTPRVNNSLMSTISANYGSSGHNSGIPLQGNYLSGNGGLQRSHPLSWTSTSPGRGPTSAYPLYNTIQTDALYGQQQQAWYMDDTSRYDPSAPLRFAKDPVTQRRERLWNQVLLLCATWLCVLLYWALKLPALCFNTRREDLSALYMTAYTLVEALLILLSLVWIYCLLHALYATAARLKRVKYMKNRYHQIAYVLIVTQINLAIVVFAALLLWRLSREHNVSTMYYQNGWSMYLWLRTAWRWAEYYGGFRALVSAAPLSTPVMEYFMFVSGLVYTIVYFSHHSAAASDVSAPTAEEVALSDAASVSSAGHWAASALPHNASRNSLVNLERYLPVNSDDTGRSSAAVDKRRGEYQQLKRALIENKHSVFLKRHLPQVCVPRDTQIFCLETACLLLEASYQSYFRLKELIQEGASSSGARVSVSALRIDDPTQSGSMLLPLLDLSRLGLELKATFADGMHSTFGYLGETEQENCVVVAFRGSTLANITADFTFHLVSLPDLKRTRAYFLNALRGESPSEQAAECVTDALESLEGGLLSATSEITAEVADDSSYQQVNKSKTQAEPTAPVAAPTTLANNAASAIHLSSAAAQTDIKHIEINRRSIYDQFKAVGASIPLMKQGFPRVHAGFWASYASVREQFLQSAVRAINRHRQSLLNAHGALGSQKQRSGGSVGQSSEGVEFFAASETTNRPSATTISSQTTPRRVSLQEDNLDLQLEFMDIPPLQFNITGHSLGGTMAVLAALDLATNMRTIVEALCYEDYFNAPLAQGLEHLSLLRSWTAPTICVYIYGCPRIGNTPFANLIASQLPSLYRVQVNGDLIAMLPKFGGLYRHVGSAVVVDDDETGGLILNPSLVEQVFLRRATGNLANHSLDKYRACLEACFEPDELKEYLSKEFMASTGAGGVTSGSGNSGGLLGPRQPHDMQHSFDTAMPDWAVNR